MSQELFLGLQGRKEGMIKNQSRGYQARRENQIERWLSAAGYTVCALVGSVNFRATRNGALQYAHLPSYANSPRQAANKLLSDE